MIETRPDWVTPAEILHLRELGVTKVQLGVQSLDDRILTLNQRGHDVAAVRRAVGLLRAAGFKLHLHWMPNLLGATPGIRSGGLRPLLVGSRPAARRAEDLPLLDHRGHGAVSALAGRRVPAVHGR